MIWQLDCSLPKDSTLAENPECVVNMLRLEKMLHPSDGVASPEFYFPHREGFSGGQ